MLDSSTTAYVFPGQGSQTVGMGKSLADASPAARSVFAEADDLLGFRLSALCWHGPEETLTDTVNAQPALVATSLAALRALEERLGPTPPAYLAGHSLGEFSALVAAGALTFADGLRLVRERGRLMKAAGERSPGAMAAVLGLEAEALAEVCREASASAGSGRTVVVANDNCPGQLVISGDNAALDRALELARARGARRAVKLPVSIAAHSPLMAQASAEFSAAVAAVGFGPPRAPVIGNVSARPLTDAAAIRAELTAQLTSPVRWADSVRYMLAQGVDTFVELGSKDVLTGLLKRIDARAVGVAVGAPEALGQFGV